MQGNRLSVSERRERAKELGIIVNKEYEFLFDIFSWRLSTKGYIESTYYDGDFRKTIKLHHFIVGTPIGDLQVDHINRNKLDNRLENLRITTGSENVLNRDYQDTAKNIRITKHNKYEVRIARNGYTYQIGTFNTVEEAVVARDNWYEVQSKTA